MQYRRTLSSTREFASLDRLEEWIHLYLLSDGRNPPFSEGLKKCKRFFLGPLLMPLSLFSRCCGPEEGMTYRVHPGWFEEHVSELMEAIQTDADMPPLIIQYSSSGFELNDGNHRFEAYTRLGITEAHVIIWITQKTDLEAFQARFGHLLP